MSRDDWVSNVCFTSKSTSKGVNRVFVACVLAQGLCRRSVVAGVQVAMGVAVGGGGNKTWSVVLCVIAEWVA